MTTVGKDLYIHSPFLLEARLIGAITVGDLAEAKRTLEIINRKPRATLAPDPLRSAKNSIICSVCLFARAAINAGTNDEIAYTESDRLINEIETLPDPAAVDALEYRALETFTALVRDLLFRQYSPIVVRAMQTIAADLKAKLGLSMIAARIGVSANYLSEIFRKETNCPLSRYVNDAKVGESVFYLKNTTQSVSEIADAYGFTSVSYYIKKFRDVYGITPNQYRGRP